MESNHSTTHFPYQNPSSSREVNNAKHVCHEERSTRSWGLKWNEEMTTIQGFISKYISLLSTSVLSSVADIFIRRQHFMQSNWKHVYIYFWWLHKQSKTSDIQVSCTRKCLPCQDTMYKNKKMIRSILYIYNVPRWGNLWCKIRSQVSLRCTHGLSCKVLIRQDILQPCLVKVKPEVRIMNICFKLKQQKKYPNSKTN